MTYKFIGAELPKIIQKNSKGSIEGLGAEISYQIAKKLNIDISVELFPMKRAIDMMRKGQADVIIGPYKSEERSLFINYSNFYFYEDPMLLYTLKDSHIKWDGKIESLKDLKIGVIRGWSISDQFASQKSNLNITEANITSQLFSLLKYKRVDVIIMHPRHARDTFPVAELEKDYKVIGPPLAINRGYFGFSKDPKVADLKEKFEREYEKLSKAGTFLKVKEELRLDY